VALFLYILEIEITIMKYIKLFENFDLDVEHDSETLELINKLKKAETVDHLYGLVVGLSTHEKNKVKKFAETEQEKLPKGGVILYHGTPHYKEILAKGFKLTKGERNFLGFTDLVDNQGIFLAESKAMAEFFGENRADSRLYKVLTVRADIHNTIDLSLTEGKLSQSIPTEIRNATKNLLENFDGKKRRKFSFDDIITLLDRPEYINTIKRNGFDSVKFLEGRGDGCTYLVFDVRKLSIHQLLNTVDGLFDYLQDYNI
jgi:hypothetical protein